MLVLHLSGIVAQTCVPGKFRKKQVQHPTRKIRKFGDQGAGDHVVFSDYMKRGGIHGSKNAYIHLDLRTEAIFMIPTPAISDVETLKAMNHIYIW